MSKNYKAIPVTMRDHVHELTNAELKVWLYLYLRTGKELTSFPGNQTIADACGMNIETAKIAKRGLRQKGWTKRLEQRRGEDGLMSTVVEKSILPWAEKPSTDSGKPSHGTVGGKTVAGKSAQQKDYTEVPEVAATPIQDILEGSVLTDGSKKESKSRSRLCRSLPPRPLRLRRKVKTSLGVETLLAKNKTKNNPACLRAGRRCTATDWVRSLNPLLTCCTASART